MHSFGRFNLSYEPLELRDGRRLVNLPSRQLEVLAVIVKAQGKTVLRDEFLDQIWDGAFVEDANLTQTVFLLRRVLGKLANGGPVIETVPRLGYRLAAAAMTADKDDLNAQTWGRDRFELREEEQLRLLVESFEDYAIYMLDCAGHVVSWNFGAEKNTGYSSQQILGEHFSALFVPEDIEAGVPDRELSQASRKGRYSGEGWRIRKSGERFWASFAITAVRNSSGTLLGYGKVVRDLSERKRQEDALLRMEAILRRERDRLSAAAESSLDALFICEAIRGKDGDIEDFVFTYLNKNVEKLVAIPREILLSGKMRDLITVDPAHSLFEHYKRVVLTGESYVADILSTNALVKGDWLRIRAVKLGDGVVITASDISELKQVKEQLAAYTGTGSL